MSPLQFGDYQPIDQLPDDICLQLGRLVAAFSHVEWLLQRTLWQTFRLSGKQGRVLTGAMNTRARTDALTQGVTLHFGKSNLIAEARAIDAAALELQSRRNEFIHGIWTTSPPGPEGTFVKARTVREHFRATREKMEFEAASGELVRKREVEGAAYEIGVIFASTWYEGQNPLRRKSQLALRGHRK